MTLGTKLLTAFLICGLAPLAIVGGISYYAASNSMTELADDATADLEQRAVDQLVALRDVKKAQLDKYFGERRGDMGVLVDTVQTLRSEAFDKLEAVREVKRSAVERYLQSIQDQIVTFSANGMIVDAMRELPEKFEAVAVGPNSPDGSRAREALRQYYADEFAKTYSDQNAGAVPDVDALLAPLDADSLALQFRYIADNPHPLGSKEELDAASDNSGYSRLHAKIHPIVRDYLRRFGYYDIFLVDISSGDIVYSVFKELDFSTSLIDGPYADTNFGEVFRQAAAAESPDELFLADYECYTPSYEAPASFIASAIFDGDEKLGVAIFQMPIDRINAIMCERDGLGRTGETYLVGPDKLMRSDSFLDPENHSVGASFRRPDRGRVDTTPVKEALAGNVGAGVFPDYNGNPVLSAYAPFECGGLRWALLAEIDVAEAFCPQARGASTDFFTQYIDKYGYYDLFLLNPDGYCFYTVAKEADYQTNFVSGKYADSNLGALVRRVRDTGAFGFADFRPYAPSNGQQAAFIAQPVQAGDRVEAIVALQLSTEDINSVMALRAGMGETGCTYLVAENDDGQTAFRSDLTFMDERYVIGYPITTDYIAEARRTSASHHGVYVDSAGKRVVAAYAPLDVFGQPWTMVAKIDADEALAAAQRMTATAASARSTLVTAVAVVAGLATIAVILLGWAIARSITRPINRVIAGLTSGAEQVTDAAAQVSSASQQLAEGASEQASSLEETSSALEEMAGMTRSNAEGAQRANTLTSQASAAANDGEKTMQRLNNAMSGINESSEQIGKIIKVIEEIAFQTNLLALNAAVEAARAGEHGKGFAVVADEVRNLAMRAGDAARETTQLITDSTEKMREGNEVAGEVAHALNRIVGDIAQATDLVANIAQASTQQAEGVEQVNNAVSQMDRVTQTNAANAEESASAAEQLSAQATSVHDLVQELVAVIGGRTDNAAPAKADQTS